MSLDCNLQSFVLGYFGQRNLILNYANNQIINLLNNSQVKSYLSINTTVFSGILVKESKINFVDHNTKSIYFSESNGITLEGSNPFNGILRKRYPCGIPWSSGLGHIQNDADCMAINRESHTLSAIALGGSVPIFCLLI